MSKCKECKETFDPFNKFDSNHFCSEDCEEIYHWNLSFGIGEPINKDIAP